jgi:hypothetical protein
MVVFPPSSENRVTARTLAESRPCQQEYILFVGGADEEGCLT